MYVCVCVYILCMYVCISVHVYMCVHAIHTHTCILYKADLDIFYLPQGEAELRDILNEPLNLFPAWFESPIPSTFLCYLLKK